MPKASKIFDDEVTIREIYTLLDTSKREIMTSINRLEDKISSLESGRITNIEKDVANIQGRLMMIPLLITISVNAFFFLMNYVLGFIKK